MKLAHATLFAIGLAAATGCQRKTMEKSSTTLSWRLSSRVLGGLVAGPDGPLWLDEDHALRAVDGATGKDRWRTRSLGPASALALFQGTVFVPVLAELRAFSASTGKPLFQQVMPEKHPGLGGEALVSAPIVAGDRLLVAGDSSRVIALDRATGRVLWRAPGFHTDANEGIAVIGDVVVENEANSVTAFDLQRGGQLWTHALAGGSSIDGRRWLEATRTLPSTLPVALAPETDSLVALEPHTGQPRWRLPTSGRSSFAVVGSKLVVVDAQRTRAIALDTGKVESEEERGGLALVVPLDSTTALVQYAAETDLLDLAAGKLSRAANFRLSDPDDAVLCAAAGRAVLSYPDAVRVLTWQSGRLAAGTVYEAPAANRRGRNQPEQAALFGDTVYYGAATAPIMAVHVR